MVQVGTLKIAERKKDRKLKRLEFLKMVEKCENKYGSISKTPASDVTFQHLRQMYAEHPRHRKHKDPSFDQKKDWIIKKAKEGYQVHYLCLQSDLSSSAVYSILDNAGVLLKSTFRYKMEPKDKNKPAYYFNDLIRSVNLILKVKCEHGKDAKAEIAKRGYILKSSNAIWKTVPLGSYYIPKGMHQLYVKTSENGYLDC